ncbi:Uncharacterized protein TSPI_04706 [Trichinella spiralis]|uniref:Uncharacterized protein n=1 Tax=Trichinella spiralis TaxID=6334 RepID=A0ABR3L2J5_TRISP
MLTNAQQRALNCTNWSNKPTRYSTEEYAFPFRLSKAISKGNPLDGMVEVMCSRILIGQKTMMDIKMEQKEF